MISQGPFAKGWSLRISISDLSPKSTKPCLWDFFPWNHTQVQLIWNIYLYTPKHAMLMDLNCKIGRSYIECVGDAVSKHLWNSYYSVWEWEFGVMKSPKNKRTHAQVLHSCDWWISLLTSVVRNHVFLCALPTIRISEKGGYISMKGWGPAWMDDDTWWVQIIIFQPGSLGKWFRFQMDRSSHLSLRMK